ncbi:hypothetical protein PSPO01_03390 [Paraphaeosphaeria sporulosa]
MRSRAKMKRSIVRCAEEAAMVVKLYASGMAPSHQRYYPSVTVRAVEKLGLQKGLECWQVEIRYRNIRDVFDHGEDVGEDPQRSVDESRWGPLGRRRAKADVRRRRAPELTRGGIAQCQRYATLVSRGAMAVSQPARPGGTAHAAPREGEVGQVACTGAITAAAARAPAAASSHDPKMYEYQQGCTRWKKASVACEKLGGGCAMPSDTCCTGLPVQSRNFHHVKVQLTPESTSLKGLRPQVLPSDRTAMFCPLALLHQLNSHKINS